jgi:hypothetical protein
VLWATLLGHAGGEGAEAAAHVVEETLSTSTSDLKTVVSLRVVPSLMLLVLGVLAGFASSWWWGWEIWPGGNP